LQIDVGGCQYSNIHRNFHAPSNTLNTTLLQYSQ